MNTAQHGAFQDGMLYYIDAWKQGKIERNLAAASIEELYEIAALQQIDRLWVMPGQAEFPEPKNHDAFSFLVNKRLGRIATISIWKRGSRQNKQIIFLQYCSWKLVWGQLAPRDLLITINYMEEQLGISITGSAGGVGWEYLKCIHPEWIEETGMDLSQAHFNAKSGKDIIWQRELTAEEMNQAYLVKFDGNGAYPYASTQTDIGVGTPEYRNNGKDMDDKPTSKGTTRPSGAVGVWLCQVSGEPLEWRLPMPYAHTRMIGSHWLSGPMIRLFRSIGYTVEVLEGWVFPEQHDVLVKWANDLWGKRQNLVDMHKRCATFAASGMKQIANATIGFTAYKGFEDEDERRRPDVRLQCTTRSTEIVWHNIRRVYSDTGQLPVMVYMDAIYYITDDKHGGPAREHFLKREKAFGGFKHVGNIALSPTVLEMFTTKMNVVSRLEYLNKIGWTK